jgi:acyl carrier protein
VLQPSPTKSPAAPDAEEVLARLRTLAGLRVDLEGKDVDPDADLRDDLGFDSLDEIELQMAAEEAFGIEIPDDGQRRIRTVRAAVGVVMAALAGRAALPAGPRT